MFDDNPERQARMDGVVKAFGDQLEDPNNNVDPELHRTLVQWADDFKHRRWRKMKAQDVDSQIVLMPFIQICISRRSFDSLGPRTQEYVTRVLAEVGLHPPAKGEDGIHRQKWTRR
jgi:hypothetical protein